MPAAPAHWHQGHEQGAVEFEDETDAHLAKAYEETGVRNADAGAVESALVEQALWPGHRGQEPRVRAGGPMARDNCGPSVRGRGRRRA